MNDICKFVAYNVIQADDTAASKQIDLYKETNRAFNCGLSCYDDTAECSWANSSHKRAEKALSRTGFDSAGRCAKRAGCRVSERWQAARELPRRVFVLMGLQVNIGRRR
jgi:hypothetical protein